ncbi:MAG TPA: hypothetical protein ENH80_05010 [Phycisphaerae bacterium]|nr:hypothetical protein [Phycisphaerae bacterium]
MRIAGISIVALLCLWGVGCAPSISTVSVNPSFRPAGPMRMAVLDFDWQPPSGQVAEGATMVSAPNAGKFVADSVSSRLLTVSGFEMIERSRLNQLLREKDLSQTDLIDQGQYKEIGQFLGVDYLVLGTVSTYTTWANGPLSGHLVSFSCRCIHVETGKVVWMLSGATEKGPTGPLDPAISVRDILNDAIPKLIQQLAQAAAPKTN